MYERIYTYVHGIYEYIDILYIMGIYTAAVLRYGPVSFVLSIFLHYIYLYIITLLLCIRI